MAEEPDGGTTADAVPASGSDAQRPPRRHAVVDAYAAAVVRFRWIVVAALALATVAAVALLPALGSAGAGLSGLVGERNPAIQAQVDALARFGLPLLSRTAVVQRDPAGLDPFVQADSVLAALEVVERTLAAGGRPSGDLLLAYPLTNNPVLFPGAAEQNTTLITYLFISPTAGLGPQDAITRDYVAGLEHPEGGLLGGTGTIPVQGAQWHAIVETLPLVEAATLAAIALIVGFTFRSVAAPLITLVTAGTGYLLADRLLGLVGQLTGLAAPSQMQPVIVALMLGITTDYAIFFMSGVQRRLRKGVPGPDAVRAGVAEYLPIVVVAGITVAAGVATLAVAESPLFQAFGPGLAITVLVGLVVSTTLVPALMAILGRWAFWPSVRPDATPTDPTDPVDLPERGAARNVVPSRFLRLLGRRPIAAAVVGGVLALLVAASLPLFGLRTAVSPVDALPPDEPVRQAAEAAAAGFAPGIIAPTALVVSRPGITGDRERLAELERLLDAQPGVAGVLGPRDQPLPIELGLFLAPDGGAARFLVVLDSDPLGAQAIDDLRALRDRMPGLLAEAGLPGAEVGWAGDTALGVSLVDTAASDLGRIAIAVLLVDLVLLVVFLRALVAPLYLLATSVLAVGAALGLTTWFFQDVLGRDGVVFYIPFAAAVLLISLGSDYNIFSVGYIWEEGRRRPLPEALAVAVPRSTRAINAAGITLAASFALVALIPVAPFQELAFAVAVGVLIDAFVVRSLLVPALVSLVGRASGWPGRRLRPDPAVAGR
ncbi:MMPL family transporter [Pseudonocardia humida]|uniref:MMPL family transporter n=1 Tax=Pseudonocardia humida TaxID=2800819 RepID=A0ABT1ACW4_9PSEU|nr:MMPL family transporter [Pseudonocardia humida]MCO1660909.1 MMPL family transporter [Pseudonocardia humida]